MGVTFGGMFVVDLMSQVLKVITLLTVAATLVLSRSYLEKRKLLSGEFLCLALFGDAGHDGDDLGAPLHHALPGPGAHGAFAVRDGGPRPRLGARDGSGDEVLRAGVALDSGLLLYGMSMVYGGTGSLELSHVANAIEQGDVPNTLALFGLVFVVAGIAFKLGTAPFHMWIPDVYHGAATPTTIIVGGAPKIAAFAFIMRLLADGLAAAGRRLAADARDPRGGLDRRGQHHRHRAGRT